MSIVIIKNHGENMKFNTILVIFLLSLITLISINCVVANENTNIAADLSVLDVIDESYSDLNKNALSTNEQDTLLSAQTIVVDEKNSNHNEMNEHTIRDAINSANSGDTILVEGNSYVHVHITVDKPLTIRSEVGTNLDPCSSNVGSGHRGIFYLTSGASGTVIEGFKFNNGDGMLMDGDDYAILINGASNVIIRNCTFSNNGAADAIRIENSNNDVIDNVAVVNAGNGIRIKNSEGITVKNSNIKNSINGIQDIDSSRTTITLNNILNNKVGIKVAGSSNNPIISYNNITVNNNAIELTSSDNINILSNYIAENTHYGINVNCEIQKINIIGNFFYKNNNEEIFNDANCQNLYAADDGENLEIINNNYFVGLGNRPVNRDGSVGGGVFLRYAFELGTNVNCPIIYSPNRVYWYEDTAYRLQLSEITQSKKGIYSISIVDVNGNAAKGLSSVPVTFYLNKNNNYVAPQEGDVYKTVMIVDGTATVRFYPQDFKESGNIVTAVLPGTYDYLTGDQGKNVKTFAVEDKFIPRNVSQTKIIISDLNTYPASNVDYLITLKDINDKPLANELITVNINSKNIPLKTNYNGQATIKINENTGVYDIRVNYAGDDIDWAATSAQARITVSKASTKFVASNYAMFIKKADYYKLTLKDASGKALANQKVTIKINKKTYNVKTNAKGVAKVKLKLKKGTYKVKMTYNGNNVYSASKANKKITVKKVLKSKLTASKVTIGPKTSTKYIVTLKDENGNAIKKQKVIIKVNGKKYTKKTTGNGQAIIKVKFSKLKTYQVKATFKGTKKYKKSSAAGKITVKKLSQVTPTPVKPEVAPVEEVKVKTQLITPDRSFSLNSGDDYVISLRDDSGKVLTGQVITYTLNNLSYSKNTDVNGQVRINVSSLNAGSYKIDANYAKTGNYDASSSTGIIHILNKTGISYIDRGLSNDEIQSILDKTTNPVVFLSDNYDDISLSIDRTLNITFKQNTTLNGKDNSPVLTISVSNFNVSDLLINANSASGILIKNADNVTVSNCTISNILDSSKSDKYESGEILIPGNGIELSNVSNVKITKNNIKSFGNAVFAQDSDNVEITNNNLSLSNYGINYGLGVKNTNISNNLITKNIGIYVMDVPEGPLGYGIFLNQSAVNVSITQNKILDNYMGISVDANFSTGIVITSNWISDNALEGIRFNAGYDLAENAVEPDVNDNAIYRNAKGPSMMILGELSANPNGIYHYGEFNDTKRLQLGANWFGKNARVTWDNTANITGYGTMCPRINATYISVKEIEVLSPGNYAVKFYNNDAVASKLPEFEMYATLNDDVEIKFYVIDGVGVFSFDSGYKIGSNEIKVSIGSLNDQYRDFEVLLDKTIEVS